MLNLSIETTIYGESEANMMQNRMQTHQLNEASIFNLLKRSQVGSLATVNLDGTPYIIPVHFVFNENVIYFHSALKGQKIDNIVDNCNVSFLVYEMTDLVKSPSNQPCNTNTKYESVIILGKAEIVTDESEKMQALRGIVTKYTPDLKNFDIPRSSIDKTLVVKIEIEKLTGKYY